MFASIIMPVYNCQKYIKESLTSCLSQKAENIEYEIVVVDDGSTDNSLQIVNELTKEKNNIKTRIIRQENQGPGGARNNGLNISEGDYVWFVDSDDTITNDAIETIENAIKEYNIEPDIILINYTGHMQGVITGKDLLIEGNFSLAPHFYVCRRQFLLENGLHFIPNIFFEDSELIPRMLYLASHILCVRKPLYNITKNEQSITRSKVNKKKCLNHLFVGKRLFRFADTIPEKKVQNSVKQVGVSMINSFIDEAIFLSEQDSYFYGIIKKNKRYIRQCVHGDKISHKIEAIFSYLPTTIFLLLFKQYKTCKR